MSFFVLAFVVSIAITLSIVRLARGRSSFLNDVDTSGPQKFHAHPVPRVGGFGIVLALGAAGWLMHERLPPGGHLLLTLLACGAPAIVAGLLEDVTKRVSPRVRLLATAFSAVLAAAVLGASITRVDVPLLQWLVGFSAGSMVATVVAVAGVANAVNIIDGFNGLASMCVCLMLCALAYVAFQAGDVAIGTVALAAVGAVLGFFVWNFPAGLIFLGDGGAYFLGFLVAELSILLVARNPQVSPLFPLLVCIYPIFETLFSMYRRRFIRSLPPSMPDGIHLHSLIYRRIVRWAVGSRNAKSLTRRNSMTSPYLWLLCMFSVIPAVLLWDNSGALALFLALFGFTYVALYWRIVRFKSPRWLRMRPVPLPNADNRRT